jgi:radical SAM superfamily enzyme YgiQ (UPF0313 family)
VVAREIVATEPDVAAFSCVTDNYRHQIQVAAEVKRLRPGILTVFGGVHPTAVPGRVLHRPEVDAVALGEAEISFPQFLAACRRTGSGLGLPTDAVTGFVFRHDGRIVGDFQEGSRVSNLDQLPFPCKAPFVAALPDTGTYYFIMTSRGCPFQCAYCHNSTRHEGSGAKRVWQRSVDNVLAELSWAKDNFPVRYVLFVDDCFTTHGRFLTDFCPRYRQEIGLPFWCLTHPLYLTADKVRLLRDAGCNSITIGVQSLTPEINRDIINRQSDQARIAEQIRLLRQAGILVQVDHILGLPGDTVEREEKSALFYADHRPDILSVFWLTYYPRVAILETAKAHGLITDADIEQLEEGEKIAPGNFHLGGSLRDAAPYYAISFLMNYIPLLPRALTRFLVRTRIYRWFRITNFYLALALPRFFISLVNPRYIVGRSNIRRLVDRILGR